MIVPDAPHLTQERPPNQPDIVLVTARCECGETRTYNLPLERFKRWRSGELIQNVLGRFVPTEDDLEMLITGTCPKCWDALFGEDEEPVGGAK